jgi:hypothetical protein
MRRYSLYYIIVYPYSLFQLIHVIEKQIDQICIVRVYEICSVPQLECGHFDSSHRICSAST